MKNYINFIFAVFFGVLISGCSKDSEVTPESFTPDSETTTTAPVALEVEDFLYRAMSDIYLYKDDVAVLADNYFDSDQEKNNYLGSFATPEALFEKLMSSNDKFSYLIEDYREMNRMSSSTERSTGMSFGLVSYCNTCTEVLGYVRLVLPGTPAAEQGVERGMIFNRVDGQQLTKSNFNSLLGASSFSIGLAKIEENTVIDLDKTISISKQEYEKNPVVISKSLDVDGSKVGYLFYDNFDEEYDEELNNAFAELKAAGVTDLVLDLRYNGGGSVRSATDLAAMITGQFAGQLFMKERWNDEYQRYYEQNDPGSLLNNFNSTLRTGTAINSLNLNRVFILTTSASASASELIINGLDPYIDVIHLGDVTTGKFQASATIYDSPNFAKDNSALNTSHKYAVQPLILKTANANDRSDYVNGLDPDVVLKEDLTNLGTLGDINEPLLKLALDYIKGNRLSVPNVKAYPEVGESDMFDVNYQQMYLEDMEIPQIKN